MGRSFKSKLDYFGYSKRDEVCPVNCVKTFCASRHFVVTVDVLTGLRGGSFHDISFSKCRKFASRGMLDIVKPLLEL